MSFQGSDADALLPQTLAEEKPWVTFDFTALFESGVTISLDDNSISIYTGLDQDDAAVQAVKVAGGNAWDATGKIFAQQYTNGQAGTNYLLSVRALGSDGSKQTIRLVLPFVAQRLG